MGWKTDWKITKSDVLGSALPLSGLGVAGHTAGAACHAVFW